MCSKPIKDTKHETHGDFLETTRAYLENTGRGNSCGCNGNCFCGAVDSGVVATCGIDCITANDCTMCKNAPIELSKQQEI